MVAQCALDWLPKEEIFDKVYFPPLMPRALDACRSTTFAGRVKQRLMRCPYSCDSIPYCRWSGVCIPQSRSLNESSSSGYSKMCSPRTRMSVVLPCFSRQVIFSSFVSSQHNSHNGCWCCRGCHLVVWFSPESAIFLTALSFRSHISSYSIETRFRASIIYHLCSTINTTPLIHR